jgi:hypothetical protein
MQLCQTRLTSCLNSLGCLYSPRLSLSCRSESSYGVDNSSALARDPRAPHGMRLSEGLTGGPSAAAAPFPPAAFPRPRGTHIDRSKVHWVFDNLRVILQTPLLPLDRFKKWSCSVTKPQRGIDRPQNVNGRQLNHPRGLLQERSVMIESPGAFGPGVRVCQPLHRRCMFAAPRNAAEVAETNQHLCVP